jgi:hypothetical protein
MEKIMAYQEAETLKYLIDILRSAKKAGVKR